MNQTCSEASKRQDQIYATDALLKTLREASRQNHDESDPQSQYLSFRQKRINHQQAIIARQCLSLDRPSYNTIPVVLHPYCQSNSAQVSRRAKVALKPYD